MEAKEILAENILGTLATVNEDGSAWATPLHVFYDDEALYWFSHDSAQHSQNTVRQPKVSVAVFSPDKSNGVKGVYVSGTAEKLNEAETKQVITDVVLPRLAMVPASFEGANAYRLVFGQLNGEKSSKNCWYFYT